jgi:type I restriction enzyme S subunit
VERTGSRVVLNLSAPDNMKHVEPGDFIAHLRSFQGGIEHSGLRGKVSTAYTVIAPHDSVHGAFYRWVLKSAAFISELSARLEQLRDGQSVKFEDLAAIPLPLPPMSEQRRIADFLDERVARIDQIITARNQQTARLEGSVVRASFDAVRGTGQLARRESGLAWLGTIPNSWPLVTVATEFHVDLGKMLDEKRQTGTSAIPYLRNTNVQWDHVDVSDLKEMDIDRAERERYCVRPGDLLICEGGQPGRSAVWLGELAPLGFQKALHRARSRGRSRPEWLLECLRVAAHLNVFAVENGQTTIGHLTNEQLRSLRLPFPDPSEQDRALERLHSCQAEEYKQSLITAAVTGELDVTTAGSGIPNPH